MTEPLHSHAFTITEANRLVPEMENVMAEIERLRQQLEQLGSAFKSSTPSGDPRSSKWATRITRTSSGTARPSTR